MTRAMNLGRPQDRAPRPPARLILTTWEHLIAFGFGAGLAKQAPGTVGTLWGLPLWVALCWLPPLGYGIALAALTVFGIWVCGRSAALLGVPDHSGIVFDEIVGFLVTALPLLSAFGLVTDWHVVWLVVAFALFRAFDILKPWPIRRLDEAVHGGFGIMLDDLVAGLYGAAVLLVLTLIF
jgi:phosphatidylglycerophosphatase A